MIAQEAQANNTHPIHTLLSAMDWDFRDAKTGFLTHSYHPYPAKYIPQIPAAFIEALTVSGDTVLDVFSGSGTTLVEAVRRGRNAIGVDANPLAALIARVKCSPLTASERDAISSAAANAEQSVNEFFTHANLFHVPPTLPPIADLDFWFPQSAQNELALIKQAMDACPLENAREFLQVAFSSIVVNVSYQDSDTRYTRRDKGLKDRETVRKWLGRVAEMLKTAQEFDAIPHLGSVQTLAQDSRFLTGIAHASVDLAVTSPPYPNAYSYHLYHRFRMEWLGFDQPRFKREEIGSHRKYSAKGESGATAETFRTEMTSVLRGVQQALKPSKFCVLVVGDSIVRGEKIDNSALIQAAGEAAGLRHVATTNRNLHSGRKAFNPAIGKIKQEHIVVLQKP